MYQQKFLKGDCKKTEGSNETEKRWSESLGTGYLPASVNI